MIVNNQESLQILSEDKQIIHKDSIFACKSMVQLVQNMEQIIQEGYKENDIEFVHKLRVTSRRIRAAFSVFRDNFDDSDFKRWNKAIKRVTKALGAARDIDVQNVFLEQLLLKLPEENMRLGVEYLLEHHRQYRVELQASVEQTLEELVKQKILIQIKETCYRMYDPSKELDISQLSVWNFIDAQRKIKKRYNEFMKLSKCLDDENAVKKHHKLRIAAKRLRYTLEIFQPLYPSDLIKNKINEIKKLQDMLGLLHDYDVWIEYIPGFIEQEKEKMLIKQVTLDKITDIERGLLLFLFYIRQKRQEQFEDIKNNWKKLIENKWFDDFSDFISYRFILPEDYQINIAIISDVHANLHALSAVIHHAQERNVQLFLNAGDVVGYNANPDEVVNLLRELPGFHIRGNYDDEVLSYKQKSLIKDTDLKEIARNYARVNLSKDNIEFLRGLPKKIRFKIGEKTFAMYHGTPESMDEAIGETTHESYLQKQIKIAKADVIITGHSHVFFNKTYNNVLFLNPGSVGRPGDRDPRAMYMIIQSHPFSVQKHRVEYDVVSAAEAIRKKNLPEYFAQMILRGVSLDMILDEEECDKKTSKVVFLDSFRKHLEKSKKKKLVEKIALTYEQDHVHSRHVTFLSLRLFDSLKDVHMLDEKERFYLECAGLLHDIGWSLGPLGHHKTSLKLILNNQKLPFTTRERYLIGCIARYHRKKLPRQSHYPFSELCDEDKKKVEYLAAILRIADALDASHKSLVKDLDVFCYDEKVIIECYIDGMVEMEIKVFEKKKDLFEKIFNKTVDIHLRQFQKNKSVKLSHLSTLEQTRSG